jgi:phosphatidylinositol alpha-1,6-mannosyltransferase
MSPAHSRRSKPRVLLVTPDFPPAEGGIQRLMFQVSSRLEGVSCLVVALGLSGAREVGRTFDIDRVPDWERALHRAAVARLNWRALRRAVAFRPDVVISGFVTTAPATLVMKTFLGARTIQYLHADEARLRPRLVSAAVRHADAVVAVSSHARDLAIEAGAERARVHVIHPGVDPAPPPGEPAPESSPRTLLTVARLSDRYKGHDVMLRALPLVRSRLGDVRWTLVGDGPLRPALENLARALGVRSAVSFAGEVSDAERDEWFGRADLFVMPSRLPAGGVGGEGFGIAYLEAAARGLPVVAGNVGGALDAVGDAGELVDPRDHVALADAIVDLLSDDARRQALGRSGAERSKRFSWTRHAEAVQALIQELAGER